MTTVSDDALKLMVAENGVRGTARMLGLDKTATDAFRKRVERAGWMSDPAIAAMRAKAVVPFGGKAPAPVVAALSPQAAVLQEISNLGSKTRLSLARGIAKAGEHIESMDGQELLLDSANVKNVAQTADLVHGWKDAAPTSRVRLDVLLSRPGEDVKEIEAEIVSTSEPEAWDDLDNY